MESRGSDLFEVMKPYFDRVRGYSVEDGDLVDFVMGSIETAFQHRAEREEVCFLVNNVEKRREYGKKADILIVSKFMGIVVYDLVGKYKIEDIHLLCEKLNSIGKARGWNLRLMAKSLSRAMGMRFPYMNIKTVVYGMEYN